MRRVAPGTKTGYGRHPILASNPDLLLHLEPFAGFGFPVLNLILNRAALARSGRTWQHGACNTVGLFGFGTFDFVLRTVMARSGRNRRWRH